MSKYIELFKTTAIMGSFLGSLTGSIIGNYRSENMVPYDRISYLVGSTTIGGICGALYPISFSAYIYNKIKN